MKSTKKEKKQYKKAFQEAMARELREHKSSFIVFSILRILVLVVLVRQIMLANYEGAFFCILTLLLLYVPSWIQVKLRIELPPPLEITIFCFIFAAEILGEVNAFYVVIPGWDTMLHTINGFLAAAVGFSMVMLLNDDDRITFHLSPAFLALVAFCFSMTIGVLWEFFEFGMDFFLGTFVADRRSGFDAVVLESRAVQALADLSDRAAQVDDQEFHRVEDPRRGVFDADHQPAFVVQLHAARGVQPHGRVEAVVIAVAETFRAGRLGLRPGRVLLAFPTSIPTDW